MKILVEVRGIMPFYGILGERVREAQGKGGIGPGGGRTKPLAFNLHLIPYGATVEMTVFLPARAVMQEGHPRAEPPEVALVERARRGELRAFEALYRVHVGRIYALCLRLSGHPGDAEEATQDCFIRAWRGLARFRGEATFSSWLHRIAVRVVFERFRDGRLERSFSYASTDEEIESVALPAAPDGLTLDLEGAIRKLPPMARLVFVLHDVEGYEHLEIASLLKLAEGTSKAHLHRARRLLQDQLGS